MPLPLSSSRNIGVPVHVTLTREKTASNAPSKHRVSQTRILREKFLTRNALNGNQAYHWCVNEKQSEPTETKCSNVLSLINPYDAEEDPSKLILKSAKYSTLHRILSPRLYRPSFDQKHAVLLLLLFEGI